VVERVGSPSLDPQLDQPITIMASSSQCRASRRRDAAPIADP